MVILMPAVPAYMLTVQTRGPAIVRLKDVAGKGTGTSYQVPVTASLDCNDTRAAAYPSSTGYGAGTTGWAVGFSLVTIIATLLLVI